MEQEGFTITVKEKRGVFDVLEVTDRNFKNGFLYQKELQKRSLEEKPQPFIYHALKVRNGTGTAASRVWVHCVGNAAACIAVPQWMLGNPLCIETFPTIGSMAVKEVANKYAPGQYIMKFPNDVVCKEHGKKSGGILVRKEGKFCLDIIGFNIVDHPPDEQLRQEGLRACCLKKHYDGPLPDPLDFAAEVANEIFEIYKRFNNFATIDDFQKYLDWTNVELNAFKKKTFRAEIINPKADIYKDGFMWTRDHPNALQKGYLNEKEYECNTYLWDTVYYEHHKGTTEKEADRKTRELAELREKEAKEKAEKEKAEEKKDN